MTPDEIDAEEARLAALTDAQLMAEFARSTAYAGEPLSDLLAGEIERRNLDT